MPLGSTHMGKQMNCKPGEMAMIVRTRHAQHLGKIVQVHSYHENCGGWTHSPSMPIGPNNFPSLWIEDQCLKPIRGDEAEDSPATGIPNEVNA